VNRSSFHLLFQSGKRRALRILAVPLRWQWRNLRCEPFSGRRASLKPEKIL